MTPGQGVGESTRERCSLQLSRNFSFCCCLLWGEDSDQARGFVRGLVFCLERWSASGDLRPFPCLGHTECQSCGSVRPVTSGDRLLPLHLKSTHMLPPVPTQSIIHSLDWVAHTVLPADPRPRYLRSGTQAEEDAFFHPPEAGLGDGGPQFPFAALPGRDRPHRLGRGCCLFH